MIKPIVFVAFPLPSPSSDLKLPNNDEDGSENITKKMNLRPFKLYRV